MSSCDEWAGLRSGNILNMFIQLKAAIAAIIWDIVVFIQLEEEYWFSIGLFCFLQEVVLFTRHFDLKAKVRKAVTVNRFLLSERSFLIMRYVQ